MLCALAATDEALNAYPGGGHEDGCGVFVELTAWGGSVRATAGIERESCTLARPLWESFCLFRCLFMKMTTLTVTLTMEMNTTARRIYFSVSLHCPAYTDTEFLLLYFIWFKKVSYVKMQT